MINNKKGVAIQSILITVVLFSFFVVALFSVYADGSDKYGVTVNETYANESFNAINEVNDIASEIGGQVDSSEAVVTSNFFSFLTLPFKGLKISFKIFDVIFILASNAKEILGIPDIAYGVFITILLIVIVFAIIGALLTSNL